MAHTPDEFSEVVAHSVQSTPAVKHSVQINLHSRLTIQWHPELALGKSHRRSSHSSSRLSMG